MVKFSILITSKDRIQELEFTLEKIRDLIRRDDVECILCDDGSETPFEPTISKNFPGLKFIRNEKSEGLIFSRNLLMDMARGEIAISLDDDLHIITENPLEIIKSFFRTHPKCAVQSFRIYWDPKVPSHHSSSQTFEKASGFAGGAHAWKMEAWPTIPPYPAWFIFHGEEKFATYHLLKKGWDVYYNPEILTHHRVSVRARKSMPDYTKRLRRSIRSGWYLYFLFFPFRIIPRRLLYTSWRQIRLKVFKGDFKALWALFLAKWDLIIHLPRLIKERARFSNSEFEEFKKLPEVKLYWHPENEQVESQ